MITVDKLLLFRTKLSNFIFFYFAFSSFYNRTP